VLSGACDGSYGVVMKATRRWTWENIWFAFSVLALAVFPVALAIWSAPDLMGVYGSVEPAVLWRTALLGFGWGVGSVFFGLGLHLLGQSIAYTVMMGMIAVIGALVPMLASNPESLATGGGRIILGSMVIMVLGVAACGMAGKSREAHEAAPNRDHNSGRSFFAAFLICLGGGVFSSMFNLAFHYGAPIAAATAQQIGESSASFRANSPIWALAMLGGFIPNALYCAYLLTRNRTWGRFSPRHDLSHWFWALGMGALFAAGITGYGVGATNLGKLGTTVAWLVFVATGILSANFWGLVCGEWHGAPRRAGNLMLCGSLLLLLSIALVSYGNYLIS
jgi:L-rhamnose-H+ transport protein